MHRPPLSRTRMVLINSIELINVVKSKFVQVTPPSVLLNTQWTFVALPVGEPTTQKAPLAYAIPVGTKVPPLTDPPAVHVLPSPEYQLWPASSAITIRAAFSAPQ